MSQNTQQLALDFIQRSNRILILPSSPPDGDSLGSAVALHLAFKKLGKESTVICHDPVPEVLRFLPNIDLIKPQLQQNKELVLQIDKNLLAQSKVDTTIQDDRINIIFTPKDRPLTLSDFTLQDNHENYDLIITVDTAELTQLRAVYDNNMELFQTTPIINIDHHVSNTHFGKINHVDVMSSSTTELILPIIEKLAQIHDQKLITEDIATLLLTGIITDTGSFQNANTTPKSFDKASTLIAYGARQQEIIHHIYKTKQLSQLKLWGRILSKIQTDDQHRIVWSTVSQNDLRDTGSNLGEVGDVIDELMTNAPGAEVIILLKEHSNGQIGGSIRTTKASVDGSAIAKQFGGGGHTQAAGFRIQNLDLLQAEFKVIQAARDYQKKQLNPELEDLEPEQLLSETEKKIQNSPYKFED